MINSLIIAYYYTAEKSSTGQILRRFFTNSSKDFYNTILSNKQESASNTGHSLNNGRIEVVKERAFPIWLEKVLRNIGLNDLMMTPDHYRYSWSARACRASFRLMKKSHYDYVHTISFPSSSHLVGYKLKKKFGLPWIAQFYDPWHGNPYRPIKSKIIDKLDSHYESLVAKYSDLIIMPCQELIADWRERYGEQIEGKIINLPFVISPVSIQPHSIKNDTLTISLIGSSNSKRSSSTFLRGLRLFFDKHPEVDQKVVVNYVGIVPDIDIKTIADLKLNGSVNIVGYIPEEECNYYFEQSDIFLAIDGEIEKKYFFPSKLLKYYVYKRPILGIVSSGSVLERELKQSGHRCVRIGDVASIEEYLMIAVNDYESLCNFNHDYSDSFSPSNVLPAYEQDVRALLNITVP